jgi:DNA-directed RNA polymerase subunit RPC12/RpoP
MDETTNLVELERVQCLECGTRYIKPAGGTTVQRNPGCPRCGYVGWISAGVPASRAPRRFALDRPRPSVARSR